MFGALSSLKDTFSDTFLTEFLSSLSNRTITLLPNIIFYMPDMILLWKLPSNFAI